MSSDSLHLLTSGLSLRPPNHFGRGSVEVTNPAPGSGEGAVRRLAVTSTQLVERPHPSVSTIPDVVAYAARTFGTKYKAAGWRDTIKVHEEIREVVSVVDGKEVKQQKTWKLLELSDYKFLNYLQFAEAVGEVRNGLLRLGITKDDVVNVYSQTRWVCNVFPLTAISYPTPISCQSELAARVACMCLDFNGYSDSIRYPGRGWLDSLAERAGLRRNIHEF